MLKRRYEILLPLQHNDGRPVDVEKLDQTREDLLVQFEAVSFNPQAVRGILDIRGHSVRGFFYTSSR